MGGMCRGSIELEQGKRAVAQDARYNRRQSHPAYSSIFRLHRRQHTTIFSASSSSLKLLRARRLRYIHEHSRVIFTLLQELSPLLRE